MNESKVETLTTHLLDGGSLALDEVATVLSLSPKSVRSIDKYLAEANTRLRTEGDLVVPDPDLMLNGINPFNTLDDEEEEEEEEEIPPEEEDAEEEIDDEEDESEPEPAPVKAKPAPNKKPKPYRFFLEGENGMSTELEQAKKSGSIITFREKTVTEIVSIIIKGEVQQVDLVKVRLGNALSISEYGVSNELLLQLALAARP